MAWKNLANLLRSQLRASSGRLTRLTPKKMVIIDPTRLIVASIREVTKLRGEVELVAPASLPNDGKVIEDLRKYA